MKTMTLIIFMENYPDLEECMKHKDKSKLYKGLSGEMEVLVNSPIKQMYS
jgi:hypothetical protein